MKKTKSIIQAENSEGGGGGGGGREREKKRRKICRSLGRNAAFCLASDRLGFNCQLPAEPGIHGTGKSVFLLMPGMGHACFCCPNMSARH